MRAGGAYDVSDALRKQYATSDANVGAIIRTCNRLAGIPAEDTAATPPAGGNPQPVVENTETTQKIGERTPKSFRWYYMGKAEESRVWSRTGERSFQERYPDGTMTDFTIVARAQIDGDEGVILRRVPDNREFFVPNKGSRRMFLRMRNKTAENDRGIGAAAWFDLGEMSAIE